MKKLAIIGDEMKLIHADLPIALTLSIELRVLSIISPKNRLILLAKANDLFKH